MTWHQPPPAPGRRPTAAAGPRPARRPVPTHVPYNPAIHTWAGHEWIPNRSYGWPVVVSFGLLVAGLSLHTAIRAGWGAGPQLAIVATAATLSLLVVLWLIGGDKYCQPIKVYMLVAWLSWTVFLALAALPAMWGGMWGGIVLAESGLGAFLWTAGCWRRVRVDQILHEEDAAKKIAVRAAQPNPVVPAAPPRDPEAVKWEGLFTELGKVGLRWVETTTTKTGMVRVQMQYPYRFDFEQFKSLAGSIENRFRYRSGSVSFERVNGTDGYPTSHLAYICIDQTDVLKEPFGLPVDHTPRSVAVPFNFGKYATDGGMMPLQIPNKHWLWIGESGGGKSNGGNVVISQGAHCNDLVMWVADGKGGATVKPWLQPFLDKAVHPLTGKPVLRPVLDWVAIDPDEVFRMLSAAVEIAEDRPARIAGNRHIATPDSPHILVYIDDARSYLTNTRKRSGPSSYEISGLLASLAQIGRGMNVTFINAAQRGTNDNIGSGDVKANAVGRVSFGGADPYETKMAVAKSGAGARIAASGSRLDGEIVMYSGEPGDRPDSRGRTPFLGDDDVLNQRAFEDALWGGNIVPGLRRGTPEYEVASSKWGYADRWSDSDRIGWVHGTHRGKWVGKPFEASAAVDLSNLDPDSPSARLAAQQKLREKQQRPATPAARRRSHFPVTDRPAASRPTAPSTPAAAGGVDEWVAQLMTDIELLNFADIDDVQPQADEAGPVRFILEQLAGAGGGGMRAGDLARELVNAGHLTRQNRPQIYRWLKIVLQSGQVEQPVKRGPYYLRSALGDAAAA